MEPTTITNYSYNTSTLLLTFDNGFLLNYRYCTMSLFGGGGGGGNGAALPGDNEGGGGGGSGYRNYSQTIDLSIYNINSFQIQIGRGGVANGGRGGSTIFKLNNVDTYIAEGGYGGKDGGDGAGGNGYFGGGGAGGKKIQVVEQV